MELITRLPAAPHGLFGDGEEGLVLVFADGVGVVRDQHLDWIGRGAVDGAAAGPDGRIYCTRGTQVMRFQRRPDRGDPEDVTASFGGGAAGRGRVVCTPDGDVWVEGCPKRRRLDGSFQAVPEHPGNGPAPVPLAVDIHANRWGLADGKSGQQVVVVPADVPGAWQTAGLEAGQWDYLVADFVGFVWAAGAAGLWRFNPRSAEAGWQAVAEGLPQRAVTAMGLSPDDFILAGFASGELIELDVNADGETLARPLASAPGAVRAVHTDRQGTIWAALDDGIYCHRAGAEAWQGTWEKRGRLPGGNHDIFAVALQGKLYVAGGLTSDWGLPTRSHVFDELLAYNPGTDSWEVVSRMSFPRRYNGIAVLDGRIWIVGGEGKLQDLEDPNGERVTVDVVDIYDPASGTWTSGPPLNTVRTDPFVMVANGRIWAIGGACDPKTALSTVESIAPGETAWRFETPLPRPTRQGGSCALNGVLYCVSKDGFFAFDTATNKWDEDLPQLTESLQAPLVAAFAGEVWVMGGYLARATYRYAPGERKWRPGPRLPTEQSWGAAAVLGDQLFITGGAHWSEVHQTVVFDDRTYVLRLGCDQGEHL